MQSLQSGQTQASKTCLHCFQEVTDLTRSTEESNEHPRSHPWNPPAVTQSWHPRKMVLKLKKIRGEKTRRELRTRGDDVCSQLAHHPRNPFQAPLLAGKLGLASKRVGRGKIDSYNSLLSGHAQSAAAPISPS